MKLGSNCKISGLRIDFCTLVLVEAWFHCFILRRIRREEVNCNQGISCTVTTNSHVNYNQNCELSFMIYFVIIYSGPASSLKRTLTDAAGPSSISKDHHIRQNTLTLHNKPRNRLWILLLGNFTR